jgi:hypothetical protein
MKDDTRVLGARSRADKKIEKLERLATNAGATPAEAENAREKMAAIRAKENSRRVPKTAEEWDARRKRPNPTAKQHDNKTADNAANLEIASLRARVAELEAQLAARANDTKPNGEAKPKNKGGRPCLGDRPMSGYERLKAWRVRQRGAVP